VFIVSLSNARLFFEVISVQLLLCLIFRSSWPNIASRLYVRPPIHASVRPQKDYLIWTKFHYVGRGRWVLPDCIPYDPIQGQGHGGPKVAKMADFKCISSDSMHAIKKLMVNVLKILQFFSWQIFWIFVLIQRHVTFQFPPSCSLQIIYLEWMVRSTYVFDSRYGYHGWRIK